MPGSASSPWSLCSCSILAHALVSTPLFPSTFLSSSSSTSVRCSPSSLKHVNCLLCTLLAAGPCWCLSLAQTLHGQLLYNAHHVCLSPVSFLRGLCPFSSDSLLVLSQVAESRVELSSTKKDAEHLSVRLQPQVYGAIENNGKANTAHPDPFHSRPAYISLTTAISRLSLPVLCLPRTASYPALLAGF